MHAWKTWMTFFTDFEEDNSIWRSTKTELERNRMTIVASRPIEQKA